MSGIFLDIQRKYQLVIGRSLNKQIPNRGSFCRPSIKLLFALNWWTKLRSAPIQPNLNTFKFSCVYQHMFSEQTQLYYLFENKYQRIIIFFFTLDAINEFMQISKLSSRKDFDKYLSVLDYQLWSALRVASIEIPIVKEYAGKSFYRIHGKTMHCGLENSTVHV